MENQLSKLSEEDKAHLLKAPALVSVLAASTDGEISRMEKADAIEMSHLRTYTAPPLLRPYYKEVEKNFVQVLETIINKYSPITEEHQEALQKEIDHVYTILDQLDEKFKREMIISLESYARHVATIHQNFLEYFMIPLSVKGLNTN